MNFKETLAKLQNLPDKKKKIILWAIVGIFGLIMGYFWVMGALNSVQKITKSVGQIKLPQVQIPQTPEASPALADSTANWKTYTNNEYNFEIKYPSIYSTGKPVNADTNLGLLTLPFEDQFNMYSIWLYVANTTDNILNDIDATNESSDIKKTKEIINGIEWNKIEADAVPTNGQGTAQSVTTFYTQKTDKNYYLRCIDCNISMFGGTDGDLNDNFNQMISTFKFTK